MLIRGPPGSVGLRRLVRPGCGRPAGARPACGTSRRRPASGPGSDGPDGVKCVLVEREQPARCDVLIDDVIQAHGGPAMVDVADRGEAIGERGDPVSVANENVSPLHLKRAIGEVSSSSEVAEHVLEPTVCPADPIVPRARPPPIATDELLDGTPRPPRL